MSFYDNKICPIRKSCPKAWWKQINKIIGKKSSKPTILNPVTHCQMDDKWTANHINEFFASLTKEYPKVNNEWLELQCQGSLPSVSVEEVREKLEKIDINKSPVPCDPYMKILKIFANNFAIPLADIFNESFQMQTFPSDWKKYRIVGVPKITPCNSFEEMRPIALTSALGKLQEHFAVKWLYEDINGKISNSQYGGLPKSSTVLALLRLLHNWHEAMDVTQRVIRIVFLDFRKAFDLIDHNKLLENMCNIGVRPALIKWFATVLKDRSYFTRVGKEES